MAMRKAFKESGMVYGRFKDDGFIYHDLRRTFYTEARRAGVPESVIKEITGHSRNQVTYRYDDVSTDDKRKAVEKLTEYRQGLLAKVAQNVAQVGESGS